ncbi:hypothetical protein J2X31_002679 [Flavobacterium arsenatis]|uniref:DUF2946 domain-containing protein n=1 Tax=Flavobacterium arsenatis TaxID=1484332 RepID=A0ABU1TRZ4_9FLAO|nr:hypothetical protein [Flavobacterium arsenatis]MDR6968653.1 hypothetical protein [Flavobacterium arsenatis]
MKKKFAILNLSLMITVLFAILFQSLHSYEHILEEKATFTHLDSSKKDVHANNHNHEKCFVCEFTFSNFIGTEFTSFQFKTSFEAIAYSFFYTETPSVFSGSQATLRGPPASIC